MNYIYLHGFASSKNSFKGTFLKQRFAEKGVTLHTPDLNCGDFSHLTLTCQLSEIRNSIKSVSGDITLMGSSMGGYLSTLIAQEEKRIKRLILLAPAFQFVSRYLSRTPQNEIEEWKNSGYTNVFNHAQNKELPLHYAIMEDAVQYDKKPLKRNLPTLILHGLADDVVPYELSINYQKNTQILK